MFGILYLWTMGRDMVEGSPEFNCVQGRIITSSYEVAEPKISDLGS